MLKGGSFLDTRDGANNDPKIKIRISARISRHRNFTAQNVGFRCAQTIKKGERTFFDNSNFRVVKLRPPMRHALPKKSHNEL